MYAEVLIEYSVKRIDKTFTYVIPERLENIIKVGMKVLVPFGNKIVNGFVVGIKKQYDDNYDLKEISDIVSIHFVLSKELLDLGEYLQRKTLCTKISAYQAMLPSSLKIKNQKEDYGKYISYVVLDKEDLVIDEFIRNNPRRKKQIEVLEELKKGKVLKSTISSNVFNALQEEGLVRIEKEQIYRLSAGITKKSDIVLNEMQREAVESVILNEERTYLLHGVTGSGKTQVYIELIKKVVNLKKTAIMIVPEISLTVQIINRFYDNFGDDVAIFHSSLSDGEKYDEYLKILRGEVHIVVGTRSAIFTPLDNLGIIIIDEEHSETYKQDCNPRYHALDMALFRSKRNKIPLVLGSATPTLESMARALKGVYTYIKMDKRALDSVLPDVMIVDMEKEMKKRNTIFSDLLKEKIRDRLGKKEQIMLFLNRRGYSTVISCRSCGFTYKCPHCDITLTYHKSVNNLRCHYCGYTIFKDDYCPECHENTLGFYGLGTEKLEQELEKLFPNAKVVRMDADTTRNKGTHEEIIKSFKNQEYDIMLGTQMIAKGLDFPNVTLVGIISADSTLNVPDFRSGERTFSLMSQVAGRAGRASVKGEVILQTFNPDNFTLKCVQNHDYMRFYNYEMQIRHKLNYPPYYYLVSIKVASKKYEMASQEIGKVKNYLMRHLGDKVVILGPSTAAIFKMNDVYRFQIILKYKKEEEVLKVLKELDEIYMLNSYVNLEIDNNPLQV